MADRIDPYKVLQVDSRGRGRGHPGRVPTARPQVPPRPGRNARRGGPDVVDQRGLGDDRRSGSRRRLRRGDRLLDDAAACEPSGASHPDGCTGRSTPVRAGQRHRRHRPRSCRATGRRVVRPRAAAIDESMRAAEGLGAAGPPPGRPSGTVLNFGRYAGWSLGEVARHDIEYIEWLDRAPIGRNYRAELDAHPALDRPAPIRRRRRRRPPRALPPTLGGEAHGLRPSRRTLAPDRAIDDPADGRALDQQA